MEERRKDNVDTKKSGGANLYAPTLLRVCVLALFALMVSALMVWRFSAQLPADRLNTSQHKRQRDTTVEASVLGCCRNATEGRGSG